MSIAFETGNSVSEIQAAQDRWRSAERRKSGKFSALITTLYGNSLLGIFEASGKIVVPVTIGEKEKNALSETELAFFANNHSLFYGRWQNFSGQLARMGIEKEDGNLAGKFIVTPDPGPKPWQAINFMRMPFNQTIEFRDKHSFIEELSVDFQNNFPGLKVEPLRL
jgi:hypothetical protein